MRKHLSHEELPTKLIKKHFHRTIWTPREKYLKHKNGNFDIELTKIWEFKINHFDLKQSLEFTEYTLEEKVNDLKLENEKLKTKIKEFYEYQADPFCQK